MQEALFGNPAPALYQFLMHDRDLPGRAAEADETELQPEAKGFPKPHGRWRDIGSIWQRHDSWLHEFVAPISAALNALNCRPDARYRIFDASTPRYFKPKIACDRVNPQRIERNAAGVNGGNQHSRLLNIRKRHCVRAKSR